MSNKLNRAILDFIEYVEVDKGLSENTVRNYAFYLDRFREFAQKHKAATPAKITDKLVHKYRLYLNRLNDRGGEPLKKSTQNYHLIALRGFLKYLVRQDIDSLVPEKIELAKTASRQVAFLDGSELMNLLEAPLAAKQAKIIQLRDKAMLELFFSTGLRVSELAKLEIEQINLNKDEFSVRGKGKKVRVVFLSPEARHWLKLYLDKRTDPNPYIFVSHDRAGRHHDTHLTPRSIQRLIQKYTKLAGIMRQVTPHTLRHSYATDLLANGADIRSVQAMLGHSSITTTQVYTHVTDEQLREVHKTYHSKKRH